LGCSIDWGYALGYSVDRVQGFKGGSDGREGLWYMVWDVKFRGQSRQHLTGAWEISDHALRSTKVARSPKARVSTSVGRDDSGHPTRDCVPKISPVPQKNAPPAPSLVNKRAVLVCREFICLSAQVAGAVSICKSRYMSCKQTQPPRCTSEGSGCRVKCQESMLQGV
jgi:hypothetical protein